MLLGHWCSISADTFRERKKSCCIYFVVIPTHILWFSTLICLSDRYSILSLLLMSMRFPFSVGIMENRALVICLPLCQNYGNSEWGSSPAYSRPCESRRSNSHSLLWMVTTEPILSKVKSVSPPCACCCQSCIFEFGLWMSSRFASWQFQKWPQILLSQNWAIGTFSGL